MAHHQELVDPAGRNYDLQSDYSSCDNGLSQQVFNGRQPLWNDRVSGAHHQPVDSAFRYDGFSARDSRFEQANDYRDPRSFDNPYNHLQNAHQTAQNFGPRAAMREYRAAIDAADRIDQRQVSRDMERNDRALMQNEERMQRAERSGASSRQLRELEMQHQRLEKQQQFLDSMKMAPVYTRSNAAFCCISRGDDQMFGMGENLLNQAIDMDPDIESNYYFNMHRERAYQQHEVRLQLQSRQYQPAGNTEDNPYEPNVSRIPANPYQRNIMPGAIPWEIPPQNNPPVAMPRPLPEIIGLPVATPQKNVPVEPVKPPEQPAKPVETRVPEKTDPPAKQNENNQPVKPFDYKTFAPSGALYNPAGPPGLGESAPGETFNWEKDGKGGWDIDWRQLSEKATDSQGYTTYKYKGEIDDSSWYLACLDGDTNFTAEETLNPQGQLYKRVMTYDGSLTYKVQTDNGPRELKDVHKITTKYNESTKNYDTEIECSTGAIYKAEVDATGKVVKFAEAQTKPASEAPGLPQANVGNFNNSGEIFHVARPVGIGGAVPGWAGGDNGILDWRETQVAKDSNGNVTYKYKGEIEDSNSWLLNLNGDTNFEGQEVLDKNNNLVSSYIKYDSSKDMKFIGIGGQPFQIADVVEIRTNRESDGSFTSSVKDEKGVVRIFKFKADGTVTDVR